MNLRRKYRKLIFAVAIGLLAALMARADENACDAAPLPQGAYRVSSPWGMRLHPLAHVWRMHYGLDLACPRGTRVSAVSHGVVIFAGRWRCFGNVVILAHPGDVVTLYAHLSALAPSLKPGVYVRSAQVIALTGSSGCVSGPHLHFEVWLRGRPMNPELVCIALQRQREEVKPWGL
jgi:murein DD-endopeptidase MepM/ murein hydrolase activator NlpD